MPERVILDLPPLSLERALAGIAAGAAERDRAPRFPTDAFELLEDSGALALTVPVAGGARPVSFAEEWSTLRQVAAADGSVGRIYDGHLNGVDRLAAAAPPDLRERELAAVADRERRLGAWGADPVAAAEEGEPARLEGPPGDLRVSGVKVFCSCAGGLDRALVLVRDHGGSGPPFLAYVDLERDVEIDRTWFRGAGMRASESHRVVFHGARVLAVLGKRGELGREPFFSRDAIRTAATWAGIADTAREAALDGLAARGDRGELAAIAAGRILGAAGTIDAWFERAATVVARRRDASLGPFSVLLRSAVAGAAGQVVALAADALGSRPFASGSAVDRARRDLELFVLQHRLDPLLARAGARALEERA